jgi:hypothetical protein
MARQRSIIEIEKGIIECLVDPDFNEDIQRHLRVNEELFKEAAKNLESEGLIEISTLEDKMFDDRGDIELTWKGYQLYYDKESFEKRFGSARESEKELLMREIKIFISSVYKEFKREREELRIFLEDTFHCTVIISEADKCPDHRSSEEKLKQEIESSDIFLIILGDEFGSLYIDGKKSITEWEYDTAKNARIPVLALKKKTKTLKVDKKQATFIEKARDFCSGHHIPEFTNSEEIKEKMSVSIAKMIVDSVKAHSRVAKSDNRQRD